MSVINQVLKDLDQRDPAMFSMQNLAAATGSQSEDAIKKLNNKKIWWLMVLTTLLGAIGILLQHYSPGVAEYGFIDQASKNILTDQKSAAALPETDKAAEEAVVNKSAVLSLFIEESKNIIDIIFLINGSPGIPVQSVNEDNGFEIRLQNVLLNAGLPLLPSKNQYLHSYYIKQHDNDLIINLKLKEGATLFSTVPEKQDNGQYRWFMRIENKSNDAFINRKTRSNTVQQNDSGDTVIKKKAVSAKERSLSEYERAVSNFQSGRLSVAVDMLLQSLRSFPSMHQSRELLATLYFRSGRSAEANILLQQGIEMAPDHLPFVNLYAQSLIESGQLDSARQLLLSGLKYAENDTNYYVQLAGVSQRLGDHAGAVNYYMQALARQSGHGQSWVGLAISLEALGKTDQAKEAYIAANNSSGLNADLLSYANSRLRALGY